MSAEIYAPTDDQTLVAADLALPALGTVLDDTALTALVQRSWPEARSARVQYIRYKPGTAVLAAVLIDDGAPHLALAHGVRADAAAKLRKFQRAAAKHRQWFTMAEENHLALAGAAADRALPGLYRALRRPGVRTLRYKPARRWVGRKDGSARAPLVKVFSHGQARITADATRSLARRGVPGPLLERADLNADTLTFTWQAGTPLDRATDPDLVGVGGLLAQLHGGRWAHARPADVAAHPTHSATGLDDLASADPDLGWAAATATELSRRLAPLLAVPAGTPMLASHGDFSADQVLRSASGELRLLDLDSARTAPAEVDLGSWLGETLARGCRQEDEPPEVVRSALDEAGALVHGYTEAGGVPIDTTRLLAYAARSVLDRSAEPFRLRQAEWIAAARAHVRVAAHLTALAEESR